MSLVSRAMWKLFIQRRPASGTEWDRFSIYLQIRWKTWTRRTIRIFSLNHSIVILLFVISKVIIELTHYVVRHTLYSLIFLPPFKITTFTTTTTTTITTTILLLLLTDCENTLLHVPPPPLLYHWRRQLLRHRSSCCIVDYHLSIIFHCGGLFHYSDKFSYIGQW